MKELDAPFETLLPDQPTDELAAAVRAYNEGRADWRTYHVLMREIPAPPPTESELIAQRQRELSEHHFLA